MNGVWIPLGLAILDWLAAGFKWKRLEPLTKTAVSAGILAWMVFAGLPLRPPAIWFYAGIAFTLTGDLLLLPAASRFKLAAVSYLLALLAFIAGLNTTSFPVNFSTGLFAAAVALPAWRIYRRISAGLGAAGRAHLRVPAILFTIAMSLVLLSALATLAKDAWPPAAALAAAGGGLLMSGAGVVPAWDRFVEPLPAAETRYRIARDLGMILLAASSLLFFD